MAKYREMIAGKAAPKFTESLLVFPGKVKDPDTSEVLYSIHVGALQVFLSEAERHAIVETWVKLDDGRLGNQAESA